MGTERSGCSFIFTVSLRWLRDCQMSRIQLLVISRWQQDTLVSGCDRTQGVTSWRPPVMCDHNWKSPWSCLLLLSDLIFLRFLFMRGQPHNCWMFCDRDFSWGAPLHFSLVTTLSSWAIQRFREMKLLWICSVMLAINIPAFITSLAVSSQTYLQTEGNQWKSMKTLDSDWYKLFYYKL